MATSRSTSSGPRSTQRVNPHAARDLADATEETNTDARSADEIALDDLARNAVPASDLDLNLEYMKPATLAEQGAFLILRASTRFSRRFNQDECVYEVKLLQGEWKGAEVIVTLGTTPVRERLVDQVAKQNGRPVGPFVLFMVRGDAGSEAWAFVSPERAKELSAQEKLPF